MFWIKVVSLMLALVQAIYCHPGHRVPNNEKTTIEITKTESTTVPKTNIDIQLNNASFREVSNKNLQNTLQAFKVDKNNHDTGKAHMGIAVPLAPDDAELELINNDKFSTDSSTSKEGISTWILLTGISSTKEPHTKIPYLKYDDRGHQQTNSRTTVKPKQKFISTTMKIPIEESINNIDNKDINDGKYTRPHDIIPSIKRKKTTIEPRPILVTRNPNKKSPITTSTTIIPSKSTTINYSTTYEYNNSANDITSAVTPATIESTTFLILEPKEADFDIPQDRSPGITTKKPKRGTLNKNNKTKKTNNKIKDVIDKKPIKNSQDKEKPLTTKIYNYLAREVMPTVGVGIVGLALTAGLATYFLGPFGALKRSYDVADRKDDMYFYNNDEYAGTDGQSEEEIFGKVIAGMPANSPYRNNIKYGIYRPNYPKHGQPHPLRYEPKYQNGQRPPQYRFRNPGLGYQQPSHHTIYNKGKQSDIHSQQFFRYNTDGTSYRTNPQVVLLEQKNFNTDSITSTTYSPRLNINDVTDPILGDNNVLQRRSQFVVGSVQTADIPYMDSSTLKSSLETIPEHGPRKRREISIKSTTSNYIGNEGDNELDAELSKNKIIETQTKSFINTKEISNSTEKIEKTEKTEDNLKPSLIPTDKPKQQNIFDLIRSIFEMKLRMSLKLLQNSAETLQRYLKEAEKRVTVS